MFQRLPNVSLEPSEEKVSTEDLAADIKKGIFIEWRGSLLD